jgi:hypothetical protein
MAGRIEHDAQCRRVATLGLVLGFASAGRTSASTALPGIFGRHAHIDVGATKFVARRSHTFEVTRL